MTIPSPVAHSSSTPWHYCRSHTMWHIYHTIIIIIIANILLGHWAGGRSTSSDIMFTRISTFVRIGAGSKAQTTYSKRSNGISPSLFPYGRSLSEKCAGSSYCYNNDNQITSAHQNYRSTIHKQANQNCSFTERMIGIYSPPTSKQVSNGYPALVQDSFAGTLRARDVRPLQSDTVALPAQVHSAVLTLINMPYYFLPQMGGRRICVRKVKFTHILNNKMKKSHLVGQLLNSIHDARAHVYKIYKHCLPQNRYKLHTRKHVRQRAHKRAYRSIRNGNKTTKCT